MKRNRYLQQVPRWRAGSYPLLLPGTGVRVLRIWQPKGCDDDWLSRHSGKGGQVLRSDGRDVEVRLQDGTEIWFLRDQLEELGPHLVSGDQLRRERLRCGLTQADVGQAMGVYVGARDCAWVSRLERQHWVPLRHAERYRRALDEIYSGSRTRIKAS